MSKKDIQVCIIDYGLGNVASVQNAFQLLGVDARITDDLSLLSRATHLVLPGVGSFKEGMLGLEKKNLIDFIKDAVEVRKVPILGICLGMQLLASDGYEFGHHSGLGFIKGKVVEIDTSESKLRLPHIGWNDVEVSKPNHRLVLGFETAPVFYFVHSFHLLPEDEKVIAGVCDYGTRVVSIIENGNVFGTQFHPEKSSDDGLTIIKNFLSC